MLKFDLQYIYLSENDVNLFELNGDNSYRNVILKELLVNGVANKEDNKIVITHLDITRLSSLQQKVLGLPPLYPFDIKVDADGTLNDNNFKYQYYFCEYEYGQPIILNRIGSILILSNEEYYLLSSEQYQLCESLDKFNNLPEGSKTLFNNFNYFSKIKLLSNNSSIHFDAYLNNENILIANDLKLNIEIGEDEGFKILPQINENNTGFIKKFENFPNAKNIYTLSDNENIRTRIIFNTNQKNELQKIKKIKELDNLKQNDLLENPNNYFNPDFIDLDYFSKRVIEIGLYKPKYYSFISSYRSQWIPGIVIEKSPIDKKRIIFKHQNELIEFKNKIEQAQNNSKDTVEWNGSEIPIKDIDKIIPVLEKQLENPDTKIEKNENNERVLIIKENIDDLEYQEINTVINSLVHEFQIPPNLKRTVKLLDHQKEGIAWMQSLYLHNIPGGLLADDMGLGKTIQALSLIAWHNKFVNEKNQSYLIIAPVSLLENWINEYSTFFDPNIPEMVILKTENIHLLNERPDNLGNSKIFLTNYETLRSKYQFIICKIDWAIVLLDEAQRIKTPGTLITNAVKALKANFKLAMTGTPVENTLVDLWCIMDFAVPGLLGSGKEFAQKYQNVLKQADTDITELGEKLRTEININLKRRLKKDILDELPNKEEIKFEEEMPTEQLNRYKLELERAKSIEKNKNLMLNVLFKLREISDHPYLSEMDFQKYKVDEIINSSAKLKLTVSIVQEIINLKEKVIIFSEKKNTQKLLAFTIKEKFGISPDIINGDTPYEASKVEKANKSRQQTIDYFQAQEGFNVIIMSPIAVGIGLNITGANHVIHYSRHWNPAKEKQATDRVYRIGQNKEVKIYYPFAVCREFKTFDLVLDDLLSRKIKLSDATLFPTEQIEIKPLDIFSEIIPDNGSDIEETNINIDEIDKLQSYTFEAAVAVLWEKLGYRTLLTPRANDKGADVVLFSDEGNLLIQAKQSGSLVNDYCVGEVLRSRGYYSNLYEKEFNLAVVTNNYFNGNAINIANVNNVKLFNRDFIFQHLQEFPIKMRDIISKDVER